MHNGTIQEFFSLAMKREIPGIYPFGVKNRPVPAGWFAVNLGSGEAIMPGVVNLDYPEWDADKDDLPFPANSVNEIHAYHFLEHLKNPVAMLADMQCVLKPGGYVHICVPYYSSNLMAQDLDHKHAFCEDTWKNTFNNKYYGKHNHDWQFEICFNLICGIAERNLCLLTQLRKKKEDE